MQNISSVTPTVIAKPFANDYHDHPDVTMETGIPSTYSTPIENGGRYPTRGLFNYLGWISTIQMFLDLIGIHPSFDADHNKASYYSQYAWICEIDSTNKLIRDRVKTSTSDTAALNTANWPYADGIVTGQSKLYFGDTNVYHEV